MESSAVDALPRAGDDILGGVELRLRCISGCRSESEGGVIPNGSRIEEVQKQQRAECRSSRRWCPGPAIGEGAPLHAP